MISVKPRNANGAKMNRLFLCLTMAVLFGTALAGGYFHGSDASDRLPLSAVADDQTDKAAYARGYVAGVADKASGLAWCPPKGLGEQQTYDLVSIYLREHAVAIRQGQDVHAVVTTALNTAFPCRQR